MATTTGMHDIHDERSERTLKGAEAAGTLSESLAGIAVIVLGIVGLTGVLPVMLAAISVIIVGGALMFHGGSVAAMYTQILERNRPALDVSELGGGLGVEFLGGASGIVLGILALIGVVPETLISVSIIAFGGALILGAGVMSGLGNLRTSATEEFDAAQLIAREAIHAAASTQLFVGLATVVLGILAVIGIQPITLSLIALLAVGTSIFLSGSAMGGRVISFFRHARPHHRQPVS